jgi:hypothetical protein
MMHGHARRLLVALALLASLLAPAAHGARAADCTALAPDPSPDVNRQAIQACLDGAGHRAVLTAGTYGVSGGIGVPAGAALVGDTSYPTIRLVSNPGGSTALVAFTGSGGRVGFVRLDAAARLASNCCTAVASFNSGDSSLLDDAFVSGAPTGVGVYLLCRSCQGNTMLRDDISGNKLGVVFVRFNSSAFVNTLDGGRVHDNSCDGVTFMGSAGTPDPGGFGVVQNAALFHNGGTCPNGIPAGGVYSIGNPVGGRLLNNQIYENCGNDVDLVSGAHFDIEGNRVWNPGFRPAGATLNCNGMAAALLAVSESTITGNDMRNAGNPHNEMRVSGDPNDFFTFAGEKFHDLPGGGNGLVAFLLAARLSKGEPSLHNSIDANTFIANCASPCVGTGYFATRDTGFDLAGGWSASTTSYYRRNDPFGSNVGSRRGGGNWYAANDDCPANPPPTTECNQDDYQHPTSVNWARNDGFARY